MPPCYPTATRKTPVGEALPPEVVAAARERDRARDLWATAQELVAELGK
jgi:hypothetical protein